MAGRSFAQSVEQIDAAPLTGELFAGGVLTGKSWISWAGFVKNMQDGRHEKGWRLRVLAAYGQYEFTSGGLPNTANPALFEVTPGYRFRSGPLISKIYMGLHGEKHKFLRPDAGNKLSKPGYGFKIISENWIDLPMNGFVSLDGSFSTLHNSYQGQVRLGSSWYVNRLSMGPEVQIVGNEENHQLRFGGFVRWKMKTGQIEGSAGYTKDFDKDNTPYFGISWLTRF